MKLFKMIIVLLVAMSLAITPCYAGEQMSSGTVLVEDSYVFTIEEAQALQVEIDRLEKEVVRQQELVTKLKSLDLIHTTKENEFEKVLEAERGKSLLYKELYVSTYDRVSKLERRRTTENIGMLSVGVVTTIGLVLVADSIDDHIDRTGVAPSASSINQTSRSLIRIRF
jgi:hypothetical protein